MRPTDAEKARCRVITSWEIIRGEVVKGREGSIGECMELMRAVDLFNALAPYLKDEGAARLALFDEPGIVEKLATAGDGKEAGL